MKLRCKHANGYWVEEDFLDTWGDMEVRDLIVNHTYGIYIPGLNDLDKLREYWGNKTVKSYYEEILSNTEPGYIKHTFLSNMLTDAEIVVGRKHDIFEVKTKPRGESRCWLEVGTEHAFTSKSGNSYIKWVRHENRYPQWDGRLKKERSFAGDYIYWKISVALDYPLAIRLVSRGPIIQNSYINTTERTLWTPH
jgi:hypothetical protein